MRNRAKRLALVLMVGVGVSGVMACGGSEPARMPDKAKEAAANPTPKPRPRWLEGELPSGASFYGYGEVDLGGDKAAARAEAKAGAVVIIQREMKLLLDLVKRDHEDQVAEIVTRYPTEDFNAHVDAAAEAALASVTEVEDFVDDGRNPPRMYLLCAMPIEAFYTALYAREQLPDEQKKRVQRYQLEFTDGVLKSLGRMEKDF